MKPKKDLLSMRMNTQIVLKYYELYNQKGNIVEIYLWWKVSDSTSNVTFSSWQEPTKKNCVRLLPTKRRAVNSKASARLLKLPVRGTGKKKKPGTNPQSASTFFPGTLNNRGHVSSFFFKLFLCLWRVGCLVTVWEWESALIVLLADKQTGSRGA